MFNLWWHPAGHQDQSSLAQPRSSPLWHVRSWISDQTMDILGREYRGGLELDHLPQFSHWSAGGPFPSAEGCLGWRRCARWGRCWAAGFSAAPRGHETALWCSWWFRHLKKQNKNALNFHMQLAHIFQTTVHLSTNAKHLWAEVGLEDSRSNLQVNSKIWSAQLSVLVRVYHNKAVKSLQLIGNKVMCLAQWLTHSPNMLKEPSL